MKKVITYGTYDHLHQGHINLLKRAKALGDYLIVGVTTENFDINRGKINVQQSLMERIESVKALGIADEVFPEEYVGQKIEDIKRYNIDIFTVGSDWEGYFDYLKEYCQVIYLPRTQGVSSTQIRTEKIFKVGVVGTNPIINKFKENSNYVNGLIMEDIYFDEAKYFEFKDFKNIRKSYEELLTDNDIVYVATRVEKRYQYIKEALLNNKHVISESPFSLKKNQVEELMRIAKENNLRLFDSIKTAFLLSFWRMILLVKGGLIGEVKAIDVTCTSLENKEWFSKTHFATSITEWGSYVLLPIFKILGIKYDNVDCFSLNDSEMNDIFARITLKYPNAIATASVGTGVKSEGDLRISGTKGYIYVPSPWWKSEYFEARFENMQKNKPYFYQSDGEGIQMELVHLVNCIKNKSDNFYIEESISSSIAAVLEKIVVK